MSRDYDIVVIGAGTGGYVAALRAAQLGLSVAVVEKQKALGGTCLLWGCIPTKAMLEHAHALDVVRHAQDWGVTTADGPIGLDMSRVRARTDKIVNGLSRGIEYLFKKGKIDWIKGTARVTAAGAVDVFEGDVQTLKARREIVIATGSAPLGLPGVDVDRRRIITSDEAIHLQEVPRSLAILGGGAVGVEFASIFSRFGSEVSLVELLPRIVPGEDEAVSAELEKSFRRRGVTVHTGTTVVRAVASSDAVEIVTQPSTGSAQTLRADYVLVATGRGPVTTGLDLERLGIEIERGFVKVDAAYRTSVPGVSAIGDVITLGAPHPQLAHVASAEGIVVAERVAGLETQPLNYDHVPRCTYCAPEIGSVGLTEGEARRRGFDVQVGTFPLGVLGRAKMAGETEGFVKIVADRRYDEILGVHIVGLRATDLVAEATLALRLESTVEELVHLIHAHPTMAEAIGEAAHALHGGALHV